MSYPPPPMPQPNLQYATPAHVSADHSHLTTLSICYYVWGGLLCLISLFPLIHVSLGVMMLSGQFPTTGPSQQEMRMVGTIFVIAGGAMILLFAACGVACLFAGGAIRKRKWYLFCLVVAAICCLVFPIGTTLGVFTFIVLGRETVKAQFERPLQA